MKEDNSHGHADINLHNRAKYLADKSASAVVEICLANSPSANQSKFGHSGDHAAIAA